MGYYNTELEKFLFSKFETTNDFVEFLKNDIYIFSDEIESFLVKTGFVTDRFDEAYGLAVRITLETLKKPHLSGVCRFKKLPVDRAIKWLKSRIVNNIKNVLTDERSLDYMGKVCTFNEHDYHYVNQVENEAELEKMEKEKIKDGLINMWKEGEDLDEILYLAKKFKVELDLIGECSKTDNNNSQLTFDFGV